MAWQLARITDDLTNDGAWHGLARGDAAAPPSTGDDSIFFVVGGRGARVFGDLEILVRIGWCDDTGGPVSGQGTTLDAQPVTIDTLPHPEQPTQVVEQISVGTTRSAAAWTPLYLRVGPAGLVTVRLSSIDAGATGATRVAVWYWA